MRALRRRRSWTQAELGRRAGCSRSAVARMERGGADRFTVRRLERVLTALDARLLFRVLWHGEELDRLLDADHARLVETIASRLATWGWEVEIEVTFHLRGERGAIDVLAIHPTRGQLLVVEVKSVVPDIQAMLAALDRKVRLAPLIARERGWAAASSVNVSRLLIHPADRTSRRRVDRFATTFDRVLPARTIRVRHWLEAPAGALARIMFVSDAHRARARHRVSPTREPLDRAPGRRT
jgi:transcriptional regulator with XRE-family HTH domain